MTLLTVKDIYRKHIVPLTYTERQELLALIERATPKSGFAPGGNKRKPKLSSLRGVGADIWEGIDAQEYVNQLRDQWERPL